MKIVKFMLESSQKRPLLNISCQYLLSLSDDRLGLELLCGECPSLGVKVHARDGGQGQVLRRKINLQLQLPLLLLLLTLGTGTLALGVQEIVGGLVNRKKMK